MINTVKLKPKMPKLNKTLSPRVALTILSLVVFLTAGFIVTPMVQASNLQSQINTLQADNSQNYQQLRSLKVEADGLEATINALQAQINGLQAEINANEAKKANLEKQIAEAEAELERQKHLLGVNLKAMYIEGDVSTIEMLASSKDLSDFFDKAQYRSTVKDKIKATLDRITELKRQLNAQKLEVERLIKEKQQLQSQVAAQKAEQNRLLSLNQGQQASVNQEIKDNFAKIAELKRQQAIENARLFGGSGGQLGGGGYPWGYAKCIHTGQVDGYCANYDWAENGSVYNWQTGGYGYRNCTDWVAFRVRVAGGRVPSGLGNANQWDDRAPAYGYRVSGTPREGAAAVSNRGFYGHVMYVEAVNGDGSIIVSDYNRAGTGKYDMNQLSAATANSLVYVYF
jgi:surface antigen/peptidoglycan hydrolase CwlO-like protein